MTQKAGKTFGDRPNRTVIKHKRPNSNMSRTTYDISKISQINNFSKCYEPSANIVNNLLLNLSGLNHSTKRKITNIESGIPDESVDKGHAARSKMFQTCEPFCFIYSQYTYR